MILKEAKRAAQEGAVVLYHGQKYKILTITMFPDKSKKSGWGYKVELVTLDLRGSVAAPMEFVKLNSELKGED